MKKYLVKFLFVIFCISLFTSCFKDNNDFQKDPLRFVPESAEIILNITNADSFVKQYTTNSVFKALTKEHRNNLLKGFLLLDSVNHLDTAHIVYSETETLNHTTLISRLTNRFEDKNAYSGLIDYKDISIDLSLNPDDEEEAQEWDGPFKGESSRVTSTDHRVSEGSRKSDR